MAVPPRPPTFPDARPLLRAAAASVLVAACALASPQRPQDVLEDVAAESTSGFGFSHEHLFQQEPGGPLVWPPPEPRDPSRIALDALETARTNEFTAPPLIVTRISLLPAGSGLSEEDIRERFERVRLRDVVTTADQLFRDGHPARALELLQELAPTMTIRRNQVLVLNRIAAYHFRGQDYETAAAYMRRAHQADPSDVVTACNLAAGLLAQGGHEEALQILRAIPTSSLRRPRLAFSVYFNMACAHSLRDEADAAIEHLARAIQADPASSAASLGDPQLDKIRADPRFVSMRTSLEDYISRAQDSRRQR